MAKGVPLLFREGIYCLDAGELGSGELSKTSLWLQLLLLDHLYLLVGPLLQGHRLGNSAFGRGFHLSYTEVS